MKNKQKAACLILAALLLWALPSSALAADVDVFAEGAYTADDLKVRIYANINADNLCSYGVTLNFNQGLLTVGTALKNEAVWYFGTTGDKKPYMNPDTSSPGQVLFIGGKLDTGSPGAGVTGLRVLLGEVTFTRTEHSMGLGTTAQDYFGISLALGKASPYDNFVTAAGVVKDVGGVAFTGNTVRQRGDANGDGVINIQDIAAIRFYQTNGGDANLWKDCNADDTINIQDIACIRYIQTH